MTYVLAAKLLLRVDRQHEATEDIAARPVKPEGTTRSKAMTAQRALSKQRLLRPLRAVSSSGSSLSCNIASIDDGDPPMLPCATCECLEKDRTESGGKGGERERERKNERNNESKKKGKKESHTHTEAVTKLPIASLAGHHGIGCQRPADTSKRKDLI